MKEPCCVVDQFCDAPANLDERDRPKLRAVCFACGQAVCTKCSSFRKYYTFGQVRLCNDCQVDYDGNDTKVMKRLHKLAGY